MPIATTKLDIINDALLATGNQLCALEDGSDEWVTGSAFYERALPNLMAKHDWKFATEIATLNRVGASAFPGYADMYALPSDLLFLINCWDQYEASLIVPENRTGMSRDGIKAPPFEYRIIGGLVHCTSLGDGVMALYNPIPGTSTLWPAGFVESLRLEIEALLLRGFNEDATSAAGVKALAKSELSEARADDDQQEPRKIIFRSRMLERRRGYRRGY